VGFVWIAAVVAVLAMIIGAMSPVAVPPANAAEVKLNASCDSLQDLDVTSVDNPQCKAVSAIYVGADGKMLYVEQIELDNEQLVAGRLVRVLKACDSNDANCGAGCGGPGCFLCLKNRCGCVC
jgi:hypothetical protein